MFVSPRYNPVRQEKADRGSIQLFDDPERI